MMRLKVSPDGAEPYELEVASRDVVAWEKAGKGRAYSEFAERLRMSDVFSLAHLAARRAGRFDGSLELFETTCDVEMVDDAVDDEPDPSRPAP